MKILIVHAHENAHSFCSALKDTAVSWFEQQGDDVVVSDLYRMNFNPVASRADFTRLSETKYYKYQAEQLHAHQNDLFCDRIKLEMQKLAEADLINFNFPLWWFSLPAILKGWVDRVFAMGFVYGGGKGIYENGVYPEKKAFITATTGGPENFYLKDGKNGPIDTLLYHINHGMFYFIGMKVLPPFVVYGAAHGSDEDRKAILAGYRSYLGKLDEQTPLY